MVRYANISQVPMEVRAKLEAYVSNLNGTTFVVKELPPELTGALFARYSRASTGLRETLVNEFLDEEGKPSAEKGSELMDRVLNAFGDDSVGELEGIHVGIEGVSQLGTKFFEDRRIGGSPLEQSTRYVKFDQKDEQGRWKYLRPEEVKESGLLTQFEGVNNHAFEVYSTSIGRLSSYFEKVFPRSEFTILVNHDGQNVSVREKELANEEERKSFRTAYAFTIRCAALDVGRCVLPSSTLTQLGIFGNGRYFTNIITHLKSSELREAQIRGEELEQELAREIPSFIKKGRKNLKVTEINRNMYALAKEIFAGITPTSDRVTLVSPAYYIDQVLASALFPYTNISLQQAQEVISSLPLAKKFEVFQAYAGNRETRRDRTGRGLEAGYPFTFDLVGCFGEYRDLERHRMLTQQRQLFTPDLGFVMPPEMEEVGLSKAVEEVEAEIRNLNQVMREVGLEQAAQYATLFNHRIRFTFGMNLRELQHLAELRTQPAGHFGYRSMVMEMVDQVKRHDPWSALFLGFVNYDDPGNKIARAREQGYLAGRNLATGVDGGVDL